MDGHDRMKGLFAGHALLALRTAAGLLRGQSPCRRSGRTARKPSALRAPMSGRRCSGCRAVSLGDLAGRFPHASMISSGWSSRSSTAPGRDVSYLDRASFVRPASPIATQRWGRQETIMTRRGSSVTIPQSIRRQGELPSTWKGQDLLISSRPVVAIETVAHLQSSEHPRGTDTTPE